MTFKKSVFFKLGLRTLSLLISFLFTFDTIVWAAPPPAEVSVRPLVERISIPASLGHLTEKFSPPPSIDRIDFPIVIHIQDAHASYEAQLQIKELLRFLQKKFGFNLILLEGGEGKLDPGLLKFFRDERLNYKVANLLAQESEVGGAELFLLDAESNARAYGLEEENLYWKNLLAFRRVIQEKGTSDHFLAQMKSELDRASSRILNPGLRSFLRDWMFYQDSESALLPYLEVLKRRAKRDLPLNLRDVFHQIEWPELVRLVKLQEIERATNLPKSNHERRKLLRWLRVKRVGGKFVRGVRDFERERNPREFLERFYDKTKSLGFQFQDYPALTLVWASETFQREIDAEALHREIEKLTDLILAKLARSESEKAVVGIFKDYLLLRKLFSLELTREEFSRIEKNQPNFLPSRFAVRLTSLRGGLQGRRSNPQNRIQAPTRPRGPASRFARPNDRLFRLALSFYEGALRRDEAMIENTVRTMRETKQTKAVMITGGFHTEGITRSFREKGIAYAVLSPHIPKMEDSSNYLKALMTPLDHTGPSNSQIKSWLYISSGIGRSGTPRIAGLQQQVDHHQRSEIRRAIEASAPRSEPASPRGLRRAEVRGEASTKLERSRAEVRGKPKRIMDELQSNDFSGRFTAFQESLIRIGLSEEEIRVLKDKVAPKRREEVNIYATLDPISWSSGYYLLLVLEIRKSRYYLFKFDLKSKKIIKLQVGGKPYFDHAGSWELVSIQRGTDHLNSAVLALKDEKQRFHLFRAKTGSRILLDGKPFFQMKEEDIGSTMYETAIKNGHTIFVLPAPNGMKVRFNAEGKKLSRAEVRDFSQEMRFPPGSRRISRPFNLFGAEASSRALRRGMTRWGLGGWILTMMIPAVFFGGYSQRLAKSLSPDKRIRRSRRARRKTLPFLNPFGTRETSWPSFWRKKGMSAWRFSSTRKRNLPARGKGNELFVLDPLDGVVNRRPDRFEAQRRETSEDFLRTHPAFEKLEHDGDGDAGPAKNGFPVARAGIHRNELANLILHPFAPSDAKDNTKSQRGQFMLRSEARGGIDVLLVLAVVGGAGWAVRKWVIAIRKKKVKNLMVEIRVKLKPFLSREPGSEKRLFDALEEIVKNAVDRSPLTKRPEVSIQTHNGKAILQIRNLGGIDWEALRRKALSALIVQDEEGNLAVAGGRLPPEEGTPLLKEDVLKLPREELPFIEGLSAKSWWGGTIGFAGLGLPAARWLIQDLGGTFALTSDDRQATATITLPLSRSEVRGNRIARPVGGDDEVWEHRNLIVPQAEQLKDRVHELLDKESITQKEHDDLRDAVEIVMTLIESAYGLIKRFKREEEYKELLQTYEDIEHELQKGLMAVEARIEGPGDEPFFLFGSFPRAEVRGSEGDLGPKREWFPVFLSLVIGGVVLAEGAKLFFGDSRLTGFFGFLGGLVIVSAYWLKRGKNGTDKSSRSEVRSDEAIKALPGGKELGDFYRSLEPFLQVHRDLKSTPHFGVPRKIFDPEWWQGVEEFLKRNPDQHLGNLFETEQRIFQDEIDHLDQQGKTALLVESVSELALKTLKTDPPEKKFLAHTALGAIPYSLAKGYLKPETDYPVTEKAFQALIHAAEQELIGFLDMALLISHFGRHHLEFLKSKLWTAPRRIDSELVYAITKILTLDPKLGEDEAYYLVELFNRHPQPHVKMSAVNALGKVFKGRGLKLFYLSLSEKAGSQPHTTKADEILEVFLRALDYRDDWGPRPSSGVNKVSDAAWEVLGDLGDIRALQKVIEYYLSIVETFRLGPVSYPAPYHPAARITAQVSPMEIYRFIIGHQELQPAFRLWKEKFFNPGRLEEILRELDRIDREKEKALLRILETPREARGERPEAERPRPTGEVRHFRDIKYEVNYYTILGLKADAEPDEIKHRFRVLAQIFHPDKWNPEKSLIEIEEAFEQLPPAILQHLFVDEHRSLIAIILTGGGVEVKERLGTFKAVANEITKLIGEAYGVLSEPEKKASYDAQSPFGAFRRAEVRGKSSRKLKVKSGELEVEDQRPEKGKLPSETGTDPGIRRAEVRSVTAEPQTADDHRPSFEIPDYRAIDLNPSHLKVALRLLNSGLFFRFGPHGLPTVITQLKPSEHASSTEEQDRLDLEFIEQYSSQVRNFLIAPPFKKYLLGFATDPHLFSYLKQFEFLSDLDSERLRDFFYSLAINLPDSLFYYLKRIVKTEPMQKIEEWLKDMWTVDAFTEEVAGPVNELLERLPQSYKWNVNLFLNLKPILINPLIEEIIFRHFLPLYFLRRRQKEFSQAQMISNQLFAVAHLPTGWFRQSLRGIEDLPTWKEKLEAGRKFSEVSLKVSLMGAVGIHAVVNLLWLLKEIPFGVDRSTIFNLRGFFWDSALSGAAVTMKRNQHRILLRQEIPEGLSPRAEVRMEGPVPPEWEMIHEVKARFLLRNDLSDRWEQKAQMTAGIRLRWRKEPSEIPERLRQVLRRVIEKEFPGRKYNENRLANFEEALLVIELEKIIDELLKNAFDAVARKKSEEEIVFRVYRDPGGRRVKIEVSDNGIGITEITGKGGRYRVTSLHPEKTDPSIEVVGKQGMGAVGSKVAVELHGGRFENLQAPNSPYQTTVRLTFPEDEIEAVPLELGDMGWVPRSGSPRAEVRDEELREGERKGRIIDRGSKMPEEAQTKKPGDLNHFGNVVTNGRDPSSRNPQDGDSFNGDQRSLNLPVRRDDGHAFALPSGVIPQGDRRVPVNHRVGGSGIQNQINPQNASWPRQDNSGDDDPTGFFGKLKLQGWIQRMTEYFLGRRGPANVTYSPAFLYLGLRSLWWSLCRSLSARSTLPSSLNSLVNWKASHLPWYFDFAKRNLMGVILSRTTGKLSHSLFPVNWAEGPSLEKGQRGQSPFGGHKSQRPGVDLALRTRVSKLLSRSEVRAEKVDEDFKTLEDALLLVPEEAQARLTAAGVHGRLLDHPVILFDQAGEHQSTPEYREIWAWLTQTVFSLLDPRVRNIAHTMFGNPDAMGITGQYLLYNYEIFLNLLREIFFNSEHVFKAGPSQRMIFGIKKSAETPESLLLMTADNGPGIEDIPRAVETRYTSGSQGKKLEAGKGLLALWRQLQDYEGAELIVDSLGTAYRYWFHAATRSIRREKTYSRTRWSKELRDRLYNRLLEVEAERKTVVTFIYLKLPILQREQVFTFPKARSEVREMGTGNPRSEVRGVGRWDEKMFFASGLLALLAAAGVWHQIFFGTPATLPRPGPRTAVTSFSRPTEKPSRNEALTPEQLQNLDTIYRAVVTALEVTDKGKSLEHLQTALQLLMGTAAVESHFIATEQAGPGPALGFFQAEPWSALYHLIDAHRKGAGLKAWFEGLFDPGDVEIFWQELTEIRIAYLENEKAAWEKAAKQIPFPEEIQKRLKKLTEIKNSRARQREMRSIRQTQEWRRVTRKRKDYVFRENKKFLEEKAGRKNQKGTWAFTLRYKPEITGRFQDQSEEAQETLAFGEHLRLDVLFAALLAREHYGPLHNLSPSDLARTWKSKYNTPQGAGTAWKFEKRAAEIPKRYLLWPSASSLFASFRRAGGRSELRDGSAKEDTRFLPRQTPALSTLSRLDFEEMEKKKKEAWEQLSKEIEEEGFEEFFDGVMESFSPAHLLAATVTVERLVHAIRLAYQMYQRHASDSSKGVQIEVFSPVVRSGAITEYVDHTEVFALGPDRSRWIDEMKSTLLQEKGMRIEQIHTYVLPLEIRLVMFEITQESHVLPPSQLKDIRGKLEEADRERKGQKGQEVTVKGNSRMRDRIVEGNIVLLKRLPGGIKDVATDVLSSLRAGTGINNPSSVAAALDNDRKEFMAAIDHVLTQLQTMPRAVSLPREEAAPEAIQEAIRLVEGMRAKTLEQALKARERSDLPQQSARSTFLDLAAAELERFRRAEGSQRPRPAGHEAARILIGRIIDEFNRDFRITNPEDPEEIQRSAIKAELQKFDLAIARALNTRELPALSPAGDSLQTALKRTMHQLGEEVRKLIEGNVQPSRAIDLKITPVLAKMKNSTRPKERANALDVEQFFTKVLRILKNQEAAGEFLRKVESGNDWVLLGRDFDPLELAELMDPYDIKAIVSDTGDLTSHWALLAQNKNIPVLILDPNENSLDLLDPSLVGQRVIVDGSGVLIVNPSAASRERYRQKNAEQDSYSLKIRELAAQPALTQTGQRIHVTANADSTREIERAAESGAEGIGLVRTEYLFSDKNAPLKDYLAHPNAEKRKALVDYFTAIFKEMADAFPEGPVTIRMFDLEEDKPLIVPNPLKLYGPAYYREDETGKELLAIELEAALRAQAGSQQGNLRILFPLFRSPKDLARLLKRKNLERMSAREIELLNNITLEDVAFLNGMTVRIIENLHLVYAEGGGPSRKINALQRGFMIETEEMAGLLPALLKRFKRIDFISIGTNDLTISLFRNVRRLTSKSALRVYGFLNFLARQVPGFRPFRWFRDFFFRHFSTVTGISRSREDAAYFERLQLRVLKRIRRIMEAVNRENLSRQEEKGRPPVLLCVCGDLASRQEFALFMARHPLPRVPVELSAPFGIIPSLKHFVRGIRKEDTDFFGPMRHGSGDLHDWAGRSAAIVEAAQRRVVDQLLQHLPPEGGPPVSQPKAEAAKTESEMTGGTDEEEFRGELTRTYQVMDPLGFHVRPATKVQAIAAAHPNVTGQIASEQGSTANIMELLDLLTLAAGPGARLSVTLKGSRADVSAVFEEFENLKPDGIQTFQRIPNPRSEVRGNETVLTEIEMQDRLWKAMREQIEWKLDGRRRAPDYRPVLETLLDGLKQDFELSPEMLREVKEIESSVLAKTPKAVTPEAIEEILHSRLRLDTVELRRKGRKRVVRLPKYIMALGILFNEPLPGGKFSAPRSRVFMNKLLEGVFRDLKIEGVINLARKNFSYHIWNDRSVAAWNEEGDIEILHGDREKSIYLDHIHRWEKRPSESGDEIAKAKIKRVFEFIDYWALGHEDDPKGFGPLARALEGLKKEITVVQINSLLPLLFADSPHRVVRPVSVGRSRKVFYVPKYFLTEFQLAHAGEMKKLASYFLLMLEWIHLHGRLTKEGASPARIHQALKRLVIQFSQKDRYGLASVEEIRKQLFDLMKLSIANESVFVIPDLMRRLENVLREERRLKRKYPGIFDPRKANDNYQVELSEIYWNYRRLGLYLDLLGDNRRARQFFRKGDEFVRLVQKNNIGLLPIDLQFELVKLYLREGDVRQFLKHLGLLLDEKRFFINPALDESEMKAQKENWASLLERGLPLLEKEIEYVLNSFISIEGNQKRRKQIRSTLRRARERIAKFRSSPRSEVRAVNHSGFQPDDELQAAEAVLELLPLGLGAYVRLSKSSKESIFTESKASTKFKELFANRETDALQALTFLTGSHELSDLSRLEITPGYYTISSFEGFKEIVRRQTDRLVVTLKNGISAGAYMKWHPYYGSSEAERFVAKQFRLEGLISERAARTRAAPPAKLIGSGRDSFLLQMELGGRALETSQETEIDSRFIKNFGFSLGLLHGAGIHHGDLLEIDGSLKGRHIFVLDSDNQEPQIKFIDFGHATYIAHKFGWSAVWQFWKRLREYDRVRNGVWLAYRRLHPANILAHWEVWKQFARGYNAGVNKARKINFRSEVRGDLRNVLGLKEIGKEFRMTAQISGATPPKELFPKEPLNEMNHQIQLLKEIFKDLTPEAQRTLLYPSIFLVFLGIKRGYVQGGGEPSPETLREVYFNPTFQSKTRLIPIPARGSGVFYEPKDMALALSFEQERRFLTEELKILDPENDQDLLLELKPHPGMTYKGVAETVDRLVGRFFHRAQGDPFKENGLAGFLAGYPVKDIRALLEIEKREKELGLDHHRVTLAILPNIVHPGYKGMEFFTEGGSAGFIYLLFVKTALDYAYSFFMEDERAREIIEGYVVPDRQRGTVPREGDRSELRAPSRAEVRDKGTSGDGLINASGNASAGRFQSDRSIQMPGQPRPKERPKEGGQIRRSSESPPFEGHTSHPTISIATTSIVIIVLAFKGVLQIASLMMPPPNAKLNAVIKALAVRFLRLVENIAFIMRDKLTQGLQISQSLFSDIETPLSVPLLGSFRRSEVQEERGGKIRRDAGVYLGIVPGTWRPRGSPKAPVDPSEWIRALQAFLSQLFSGNISMARIKSTITAAAAKIRTPVSYSNQNPPATTTGTASFQPSKRVLDMISRLSSVKNLSMAVYSLAERMSSNSSLVNNYLWILNLVGSPPFAGQGPLTWLPSTLAGVTPRAEVRKLRTDEFFDRVREIAEADEDLRKMLPEDISTWPMLKEIDWALVHLGYPPGKYQREITEKRTTSLSARLPRGGLALVQSLVYEFDLYLRILASLVDDPSFEREAAQALSKDEKEEFLAQFRKLVSGARGELASYRKRVRTPAPSQRSRGLMAVARLFYGDIIPTRIFSILATLASVSHQLKGKDQPPWLKRLVTNWSEAAGGIERFKKETDFFHNFKNHAPAWILFVSLEEAKKMESETKGILSDLEKTTDIPEMFKQQIDRIKVGLRDILRRHGAYIALIEENEVLFWPEMEERAEVVVRGVISHALLDDLESDATGIESDLGRLIEAGMTGLKPQVEKLAGLHGEWTKMRYGYVQGKDSLIKAPRPTVAKVRKTVAELGQLLPEVRDLLRWQKPEELTKGESQQNSQKITEALNQARSTAEELQQITDSQWQLLTGDLELEEVELPSFLEKSLEAIKNSLRSPIQLTLSSPVPSLKVRIQPRLIRRLLGEMARNVRTIADESETRPRDDFSLQVSAALDSDDPNYFILKVSDNAGGIPSELLEKVRERGGRLKLFTLKGTTGSGGVGLTEAWVIVQRHGGSIKVFSEAGKGATFRIRLPVGKTQSLARSKGFLPQRSEARKEEKTPPRTEVRGKRGRIHPKELVPPFDRRDWGYYSITLQNHFHTSEEILLKVRRPTGGKYRVYIFARDRRNQWKRLGSIWFTFESGWSKRGKRLVSANRIKLLRFFPLQVKSYRGRKIAKLVVAWLAHVADSLEVDLENSGTQSSPLTHIYRRFFADEIHHRQWIPLAKVRGFYSEEIVGTVLVRTADGERSNASFEYLGRGIYKSSLPFPGRRVRINERGVISFAGRKDVIGTIEEFARPVSVRGKPKPVSLKSVKVSLSPRAEVRGEGGGVEVSPNEIRLLSVSKNQRIVVIAEDDPDFLSNYKLIFERTRWKVVGFNDGQSVLDYFKNPENVQATDLLVSDNQMPRIKGKNLIQELRKKGHQIPVVFNSLDFSDLIGRDWVNKRPEPSLRYDTYALTELGVRELGLNTILLDKSDIRQFLMMINKLNERGFLTLEDLSRAEVRSGLRHGEDPNLTEPLRKAERPWLQDNELLKWNLRTTTTRTLKFLMERIDERGIFKPEELEGIVLIGGPGFNDTQILEIARRFTRAQFVAVDIDGRSIKFLRNNVLKADPTLAGRIRFLEGDLRDLRHLVDADESVIELPDQSVAVAIYPAVFDIYQNDYQDDYVRLRELGKIISESRRVLKAGGILGAAPFSDAPHKLMQNLGFEDLDPDDRKHESFLLYRKPESPKSISGSEPPTARSEMRSASPARGELRRTDASAVEVAVGALFGVMAKEVWQGLNRSETRALWITIRPASVRVRRDEMTGQKTWRQAPGSESSQIAFPPQGVAARNDRRAGQSSRARQVVFLSPTDQWITSQAETAPVFASAA